MKIAVWIVSALLALFFLSAGAAKAFAPWEVLEAGANGVSVILFKIAGILSAIIAWARFSRHAAVAPRRSRLRNAS